MRAAALTWGAFLGLARGQTDAIAPYLAEAEALLERCDDHDNAAYRLLVVSRVVAGLGDYERSVRVLDMAQAHAEAMPDGALGRAARHYIDGQRSILAARPEDAMASLQRASPLFRAGGDRFAAVVCLTEISFAAESAGDHEAMAAALREALELVSPLGFTSFELVVRARLGAALIELDDEAAAEEMLLDTVRVARAVSYRPALAFALNGLARLRSRQGRLDEAEPAAREALERQLPDQPTVRASSFAVLGEAALQRGDHAAAVDHYTSSLDEARRANNAAAIADATDGLARAGAPVGVPRR
jgi:tetratricopeptide (TPR) repeat protein